MWIAILVMALLWSNCAWAFDAAVHWTLDDSTHHAVAASADTQVTGDHTPSQADHDHSCHAQLHLLGLAAYFCGATDLISTERNSSVTAVFRSISSSLPNKPPRV